MPKIISAFSAGPSPLAQMMKKIGASLTGGKQSSQLDIERAYEQQRMNTERENLARWIAEHGAQNLGADPTAQAILSLSGMKPEDFGDIGLMGAATGWGAKDPRTQNWQVGTGQPYGNTFDAFDTTAREKARDNDLQSADRRYGVDQKRAQDLYEFENKPIAARGAGGAPVFVPQGNIPDGTSPVLSETDVKGGFLQQHFNDLGALNPYQLKVLGAEPSTTARTPRNYIAPDGSVRVTYDGVTDAQTGESLAEVAPGGHIGTVEGGAADVGLTNATRTDVQSDILAADRFSGLADRMLALTDDPAAFGLIGKLRSMGQEGLQAWNALSALMGGPEALANETRAARAALDKKGLGALIPELYDPKLPRVQMLGGLLLYSGASALAGQENRSVSDKDIGFMQQILGDPQSIFESSASISTKVSLAKEIVQEHKRIAQRYLKMGIEPPDDGSWAAEAAANVFGGAPGGGPGAAPEAAPGAAPEGAPVLPEGVSVEQVLETAKGRLDAGAPREQVIETLKKYRIPIPEGW